jgi:bacteriorhodopsin
MNKSLRFPVILLSAFTALALFPQSSQAASVPALPLASANLNPADLVGVSFWYISMALVAATAFFFNERIRVSKKWSTSLNVSGLVTLVAAVHYFYMREVWVTTGSTPTVFRYIDWLITVPLLMVEFYLILSAVTKISVGIFWRLLVGSLVMLIGGYLGEAKLMAALPAFVIGMAGWAYIIYEIFLGEASKANASLSSPAVQSAFKLMRIIVIVGWSIYPIGYYIGYLTSADTQESMKGLNLVYNLADVLNKIAFGVVIWAAAVKDSDAQKA